MRRKRLSLAKRRHKELRSFAGAPLRRFLAKCRSRYHFSKWHMIKRRVKADRRNGRQRSKKAGHETRNMWTNAMPMSGFAWLGRARPRPEPTAPHGSYSGYFSIRADA